MKFMADPTTIQHAAEAAVEAANIAASSSDPIAQFGLNVKIFIAQLINFGIVLIVLWRFVYRPIVKLIEAREEKIEKSIKHAEEVERRLNEATLEKDAMLKDARIEAQRIVEEARDGLKQREEESLTKTREEVAKIVQEGKGHIARDRQEMLASVKRDVVDVAIEAARAVLAEGVSEKSSQKIAKKIVEERGL